MGRLLFGFFLLLIASPLLGQKNDDDKQNKILTQRIAFLTDELDLSVEEAQAFWPVYNEYQKAKNKISDERSEDYKAVVAKIKKMTDEECESHSDRFIQLESEEARLAEEFHQKYKKVLPPKKLLKLYHAESKFKTYLLQQLREKKDKDSPDQ